MRNWGWGSILCFWAGVTFLNGILLPARYGKRVPVETVKVAPLPLIVRASGNLEGKDSVTVKAQFDGPVNDKKFEEGQVVAKGQLLAVLGRERVRMDYQGKLDALTNAKADLSHARRDLRLQKTLYEKQAVAYSAVDDAARALVKAEQALRTAEESFALEQKMWNSSNVTAPMAGTVVKDWIGDDKFVAAGKELITVADVTEYTVRTRVDELDIKQVHIGEGADVHIEIFPQSTLKAVVSQIGAALDSGAGLPEVPVVLKLRDTQGLALRPKLTAEVRILTGKTQPTVSVPLTAIVNSDGEAKVWVVDAFHRLRPRSVELGKTNPDRVEITKGLNAGDRICVTAEPDFASGMRILFGVSSKNKKKALP